MRTMFDYLSVSECQDHEGTLTDSVTLTDDGRVILLSTSTNATEHFIGTGYLDDPEMICKPEEEIVAMKLFLIHGRYLEHLLQQHPEVLQELGLAYEEIGGYLWLVGVEPEPAAENGWLRVAKLLAEKRHVVLLLSNPSEATYVLRFLDPNEDLTRDLAEQLAGRFPEWIYEDADTADKFSCIPFLINPNGMIATREEALAKAAMVTEVSNENFGRSFADLLTTGVGGEMDRWSARAIQQEIYEGRNPPFE